MNKQNPNKKQEKQNKNATKNGEKILILWAINLLFSILKVYLMIIFQFQEETLIFR